MRTFPIKQFHVRKGSVSKMSHNYYYTKRTLCKTSAFNIRPSKMFHPRIGIILGFTKTLHKPVQFDNTSLDCVVSKLVFDNFKINSDRLLQVTI